MSAQQQHHVTTAYLASGSVAVGQCVVLTADGRGYVAATAANRATHDRRTAGISLRAGDANNTAFEMQVVGQIPPEITRLGAGTESLIRVSDAGVLERVGSYSTSDDVCGYCDADGNAYVCFPLVGLGAALGASSAPGLPARSVQYYLDANTLGGAAKAGINSDGSLALYPASTADALPASGTLRTAEGFTLTAKYVSAPAAVLRYVHYLRQDGVYFIGGITTFAQAHRQVTVRSQFASELAVIAYDDSTAQKASVRAFGPDAASPTAGTQAEYGGWLAPNSYLNGTAPATPSKPFGGGDGIGVIAYQRSAPATGALASTMMFRVTGPGIYEVLFPGDDVTTGWRNLLEEAGTKTITASPAASLDMAGYGHLDIRAPSGVVNIKGFIAPSGRAKRFTITNNNQDSADVKLKFDDAGASATADRIWSNSSADITILFGDTYLITYSQSLARWTVVKGGA